MLIPQYSIHASRVLAKSARSWQFRPLHDSCLAPQQGGSRRVLLDVAPVGSVSFVCAWLPTRHRNHYSSCIENLRGQGGRAASCTLRRPPARADMPAHTSAATPASRRTHPNARDQPLGRPCRAFVCLLDRHCNPQTARNGPARAFRAIAPRTSPALSIRPGLSRRQRTVRYP